MPPFAFDPVMTPDDQIQTFLDYLKGQDPKLTALLQEALVHLTPLPEGQQRTAARQRATAGIIRALEEDATDS